MTNSYLDLVQQTFNFPQEGFEVKDGYLQFNGVDVKALIDKYGTPLKLSYLPKIGNQIRKAKQMFAAAFKNINTKGSIFIVIAPRARISVLWWKKH
jgi:arginine decarboxylase